MGLVENESGKHTFVSEGVGDEILPFQICLCSHNFARVNQICMNMLNLSRQLLPRYGRGNKKVSTFWPNIVNTIVFYSSNLHPGSLVRIVPISPNWSILGGSEPGYSGAGGQQDGS